MKIKFFLLLALYSFQIMAQGDTTIWEYSAGLNYKQKFSDGYHILKKQNIVRQEFRIRNGKLQGLVKEYY